MLGEQKEPRSIVSVMNSYRSIAWRGLIFILLAIFNSGCSVFGIRTYETTEYELIFDEANKEIRYYDSYIVAKTTVKGEFKEAQGAAFRILAGYIFGDNEKKQKIAMTAPVVQEPTAEREKIQMTTPVIQRPSEEGWVMSFMMPSVYKMEDLPRTPKDKRIRFETYLQDMSQSLVTPGSGTRVAMRGKPTSFKSGSLA